jgi:hypothetical protein
MKSVSCSCSFISIPKSTPIPIQKSPTNQILYASFRDNTYILKQNSFDPTKNSPPNDFMLKLQNRMNSMNSIIQE